MIISATIIQKLFCFQLLYAKVKKYFKYVHVPAFDFDQGLCGKKVGRYWKIRGYCYDDVRLQMYLKETKQLRLEKFSETVCMHYKNFIFLYFSNK